MKKTSKIIMGLLAFCVGLLFIILKENAVNLSLIILGITAIVLGIVDIMSNEKKSGTIKALAGAAVIVFGKLTVKITLYAIAALMIFYCLGNMYINLKSNNNSKSIKAYIKPLIGIAAGIILLFNQGGTLSWIFIVSGIVFIVEGTIILYECKK